MFRFCLSLGLISFATASLALDEFELPAGFVIEEYADVPNARSLALGSNGTVFVSSRSGNAVFAVLDEGNSRRIIKLLRGLKAPNGIAFYNGDLYVAENDRVTRYADIESNLDSVPKKEVLDIDLPSKRQHGRRYIDFGPDGKLYISIGAPCNVCDEKGFANIIRVETDGSGREVFASGVRNSVGFTWQPDTGDFWFTDNGRDMMGDNRPGDELNRAGSAGQHFGFPYCHAGNIADPKFGANKNCDDYEPPQQILGPHVAALGLRFYSGEMFPEDYRGQLFIAEHGSWNRSKKVGYRVTLVRLENGAAVSYEPFAGGWLNGEAVSGRPVDLLVLEDGSMLVSDDHAGKIYRISYANAAD